MTALDEALWPRAALPRRPMLGAVLDALTVRHDDRAPLSERMASPDTRAEVTDAGVTLHRPGVTNGIAWVTTNVAEAYELLQARDLVPMGYVGRFVCSACNGSGLTGADKGPRPAGARGGWMCACLGEPQPHPPTVAALASWASLGFAAGDDGSPGILGAEEWAREIDDSRNVWWGVSDRPPTPLRGADPGAAISRLTDAGLRWEWQGGAVDRVTLYVPPLGLVTP